MGRKEWQKQNGYGTCHYDPAVISIARYIEKGKRADSLLHEALHAAWYVFKGASHPADEEDAVNTLATGTTMIFRDNPELFRWWHSELESVTLPAK